MKKSKRIAFITEGHSEFDDDVLELLLKERFNSYQESFTEYNYIDFSDCFILAGADIKSRVHKNFTEIEIFISPQGKPEFLKGLNALIAEKERRLTH